MNVMYVFSTPGILKCLAELFNFIAFMCLVTLSVYTSKAEALMACSIMAFIVTGICLVLYILGMQDKMFVPVRKVEFLMNIIFVLFYLPTLTLVLDVGNSMSNSNYLAGGSFAVLAVIVYIGDIVYKVGYSEDQ